MNILTIAGNLGSDAEVRYSKAGTAITHFSVPAKSGWGERETVTWVNCTLFGRKGENQPHGMTDHLKKGRFVVVTGEFSAREWEGQNGVKHSVEMVVRDITPGPAGSPKPAQAEPDSYDNPSVPADPAPAQGAGVSDDDIPFAPFLVGELV